MAKTDTKNQAASVVNPVPVAPGFEMPNFDAFVSEQIGFAPYWTPETGKWFYAVCIGKDERDPEFTRFLFKLLMPTLECHTGGDENKEPVTVKLGEHFSMSAYAQLTDPFSFYLGCPFPVPIRVRADKKVKGGKGEVWLFKVDCEPKVSAQLMEHRASLIHEKDERAALQA